MDKTGFQQKRQHHRFAWQRHPWEHRHISDQTSPNLTDRTSFLKILLKGEEDLCSMIAKENPKATLGTQNLLQQLCDDSEARQYQIKQRL